VIRLAIAHTWDGHALPAHAHAELRLERRGDSLWLEVDAPFHGDPPPPLPAGPADRLWEHEVVELFLAGPGARYFELELGPHGHHLALVLDGVRQPLPEAPPVDYVAARVAGSPRFRGTARVAASVLPAGPLRANAYAVHASSCVGGEGRCHHAHAPVLGTHPDFHRLECFVPIVL